MLQQKITKTEQKVPMSFIEKLMKKMKYKEYKDNEGRIVIETTKVKLVQVRQNNKEDKEKYINVLDFYLNKNRDILMVDEKDKDVVVDLEKVFEFETQHYNYNEFPMFFTYTTANTLLGVSGFRMHEKKSVNGKEYDLYEGSFKFSCVIEDELKEQKGLAALVLFHYANIRQEYVFGDVFPGRKDFGFHLCDFVKDFKYVGKRKFVGFFENTNCYYFDNLPS